MWITLLFYYCLIILLPGITKPLLQCSIIPSKFQLVHSIRTKISAQNTTKLLPRAAHMQYPHVLYPSLTRFYGDTYFLFQFELKHEDT